MFKYPLRRKIDIYLNPGAHEELERLIAAGLRDSSFRCVAGAARNV